MFFSLRVYEPSKSNETFLLIEGSFWDNPGKGWTRPNGPSDRDSSLTSKTTGLDSSELVKNSIRLSLFYQCHTLEKPWKQGFLIPSEMCLKWLCDLPWVIHTVKHTYTKTYGLIRLYLPTSCLQLGWNTLNFSWLHDIAYPNNGLLRVKSNNNFKVTKIWPSQWSCSATKFWSEIHGHFTVHCLPLLNIQLVSSFLYYLRGNKRLVHSTGISTCFHVLMFDHQLLLYSKKVFYLGKRSSNIGLNNSKTMFHTWYWSLCKTK